MQFNDLYLNIDVTTGNLIRDFDSFVPIQLPPFKSGDKRRLLVRLLEPTRIAGAPWREVSLDGYTVRAAIGIPTEPFDSGTFTVTYGADTTAALSNSISATDLETALNGLASVTAAGGLDVVGVDGGPWIITWRTVGDKDNFTLDPSELVPVGSGFVDVVTEGDGSTQEQVVMTVEVGLLAYSELSGALDSATVTITELIAGSASTNEVQRIDLSSPQPYAGSYTLAFGGNTTDLIDHEANAATIQAALEALASIGAGNVSVSGTFPVFEVEFIGTKASADQALITADASGLRVPTGKSGILNLATKEMITFFRGERDEQAYFEIQVSDGAENNIGTLVQVPVDLIEDVINPSLITPITIPSASDWLSARAVRIDIANVVSAVQAAQHWSNLGVQSYADLPTANAAEGAINVLWRNSTTGKLQMTTSAS